MYTRKIVKRQPVPTFKNLDDFFAKGIDQFFGSDFVSSTLPQVNVLETEKTYELELVAAGFAKEDFKISTDKNVLTISADVEQGTDEESVKYTRREFRKTSFKRSFKLSDVINKDAIEASYENGILQLTLPKDEAVVVKRTIKVS